jgi:hypothetical protein
MKTKIVLWGKDSDENKSLIALQLLPDENKVKTWVFSGEAATEELGNQLLFEWREDKEVFIFPEGSVPTESDLTVSGSLVPEGITVDKQDILQRAQTEWHFMVLSSKLNQSYVSELDDFAERINQLTAYDHKAWEDLKNFWAKVREQMQERNLFRDHATQLKERTNTLFSQLKEFRAALDAEFKAASQASYDRFAGQLEDLEARIEKNINLQSAFDELKRMQNDFKTAKLTRDSRNEIWKRIDKAFKVVKEKRFGPSANNNNPTDRLSRRYDGLMNAIHKMTTSIKRDEEDLSFQHKKINSVHTGQLETQIRQAKLKMIQERIDSKNAKLQEMLKTKVELEDKMEQAKARAERRQAEDEAKQKAAAEKAAIKAAEVAKAAAEAKIAEPIVEEKPAEKVEAVVEEKITTETPKEVEPIAVVEEAPAPTLEVETPVTETENTEE